MLVAVTDPRQADHPSVLANDVRVVPDGAVSVATGDRRILNLPAASVRLLGLAERSMKGSVSRPIATLGGDAWVTRWRPGLQARKDGGANVANDWARDDQG
jgi:hypothetical protein